MTIVNWHPYCYMQCVKESKIADIVGKRFRKLSDHYGNIRRDFNADDIHDLRTETKRLRSFIRLLKSAPGTDRLSIPPKLKAIYTYLGAIRTLQLQSGNVQDVCNKMSIPPPGTYLDFLASQEQAWRERTGRKMDHLHLKEQEKKMLRDIPHRVSRKHIQAFISSVNRKLHMLLTLPFFYDEALHDIRKRLKDIHYNWKYIQDDISILSPAYLRDPGNVKQLTDKLGDFHDRCVILHLLESIYTRHINNSREADTLQAIIVRMQSEKQDMKEDVIRHLLQLKKLTKGQLEVSAAGIIQKSMLEV